MSIVLDERLRHLVPIDSSVFNLVLAGAKPSLQADPEARPQIGPPHVEVQEQELQRLVVHRGVRPLVAVFLRRATL